MSHSDRSEPQYLGVPLFFAGKTWLIPSLSVMQFQTNYDLLASPLTGDSKEALIERFKTYIPLIGSALRRNYPDLKDTDLYEHLDMHTFSLALRAIQNASGMKVVKPGEAVTQPTA